MADNQFTAHPVCVDDGLFVEIDMKVSKDGVRYTDKKPVIQDGKTVGYRLYDRSGCFKTLHFVGYLWLKKKIE